MDSLPSFDGLSVLIPAILSKLYFNYEDYKSAGSSLQISTENRQIFSSTCWLRTTILLYACDIDA
jgi:hypothetical protein